jgi:hypothetical protein
LLTFLQGEKVQVAGHKGIVMGLYRSVAGKGLAEVPCLNGKIISAEMQCIYSVTVKVHVLCHSSFIIKQHEEGDTVFSLGLNENVVVVECDYFMHEVKIELPATAARRYKKEPLVSIYFII